PEETSFARNILNESFPDRWIGRGGRISWPARSPGESAGTEQRDLAGATRRSFTAPLSTAAALKLSVSRVDPSRDLSVPALRRSGRKHFARRAASGKLLSSPDISPTSAAVSIGTLPRKTRNYLITSAQLVSAVLR
ncbi:hypothetical protein X777_03953, partial [Ooceraea biroi]